MKEGGHSLLPVEVPPSAHLPEDAAPECWLGPRVGDGVSFTEMGDSGRGARCRQECDEL